MGVTLIVYTISTVAYLWTLAIGGKFTIVNTLFYAIVPFVTILGGWFLFRDVLSRVQILALCFALAAIVLFALNDLMR
jgi:EamA domain-containing membrane protein RarD